MEILQLNIEEFQLFDEGRRIIVWLFPDALHNVCASDQITRISTPVQLVLQGGLNLSFQLLMETTSENGFLLMNS